MTNKSLIFHLYIFQITHEMKQCTTCQSTTYHNTTNHSGYFQWLELLWSHDIHATNSYQNIVKLLTPPRIYEKNYSDLRCLKYLWGEEVTNINIMIFQKKLFYLYLALYTGGLKSSCPDPPKIIKSHEMYIFTYFNIFDTVFLKFL